MMRRSNAGEREKSWVNGTRGFLGYLCLIIFFGGVIFIVQASMEVKRIRYSLTEANTEKMNLLKEIQKIDNRISELEQYSRIAKRLETSLPYLGPPLHPAIELKVPGLRQDAGMIEAPVTLLDDNSPMAKMRNNWKKARKTVRDWLGSLIE